MAAPSLRVLMTRTSGRSMSASMSGLIGPPGRPKMVSTPWEMRMSTRASAARTTCGACSSARIEVCFSSSILGPSTSALRSPPHRLMHEPELLDEHLRIHGLRNTAQRPRRQRVFLYELGQVRAVHDDADVARLRVQLEPAAHFDAVELGHVDVEHDEVGLEAPDHDERVDAVLRQRYLDARAIRLQPPLERAQRDEVVVHDQEPALAHADQLARDGH